METFDKILGLTTFEGSPNNPSSCVNAVWEERGLYLERVLNNAAGDYEVTKSTNRKIFH